MERQTHYKRVWFSSTVLREACQVFHSRIADDAEDASCTVNGRVHSSPPSGAGWVDWRIACAPDRGCKTV